MLERLAAAASAILVGACSVVGVRSGTEEPRYTVVSQLGDVEVRRYPARVVAEIVVRGNETEARGEGFRRLARYIFGGNAGALKIAMTAPVAQQARPAGERIAMTAPVAQLSGADGWTIRFFMPADRTLASLPAPNDSAVVLREVAPAVVAVLRFSGVPDPARVAQRRTALAATLADSRWRVTGPGEDWLYDPPWTLPPLRRNEVIVPVEDRR